MARQRKQRPFGNEIIKVTNSIIHWNTIGKRFLYGRENRLSVFVTSGECRKKRIVAINNLDKRNRFFTGCCDICARNLPYEKKRKIKPPKKKWCSHGYIKIFMPDNPMADKRGEVYEHRLVMSQLLNRPLKKWEIVHHIDGTRANNSPGNLKIFPDSNSHQVVDRMRIRIKELEALLNHHNIPIP